MTPIFILLIHSFCFCQMQEVKIFSGNGFDDADAILQHNENLIVGISTTSQSGNNYDILLMEVNSTCGKVLQEKYFGDSEKSEFVKHISATSDNQFLISYTSTISSPRNAALMKLDADLNIVWSIELPSFGYRVEAVKTIEDTNGNYILLGSSSNGDYSSIIYTIDDNGQLINSILFEGLNSNDFEIAPDNNYILAGKKQGNGSYVAQLMKVSQDGSTLWEKSLAEGPVAQFNKVLINDNQEIIAALESKETLYRPPYFSGSIIQLNESGSQIRSITTEAGRIIDFVLGDNQEFALLLGTERGDSSFLNYYLLDQNLEVKCSEQNFANTMSFFHTKMNFKNSNDLQIVSSDKYGALSSAGVNLFLFSSTCNADSGMLDSNCETSITLSPNPSQDFICLINDGNKEIIKMSLWDASGRLLRQWKGNEISDLLDISSFASGVYFLNITSSCGNESKKLIIQN